MDLVSFSLNILGCLFEALAFISFVRNVIRFFPCIMPPDRTDQGSFAHFRSASLPMQRFQALSTFNLPLLHNRAPSNGVVDPKNICLDAQASNATNLFSNDLDVIDKTCQASSSFTSSVAENSLLQHASTSETSTKDQVIIFSYHFPLLH